MCGLLVNCSRSIIFAGAQADFPSQAAAEAARVQREMAELLERWL
jgi:orotidine-5'-phosphate decarboxylase